MLNTFFYTVFSPEASATPVVYVESNDVLSYITLQEKEVTS